MALTVLGRVWTGHRAGSFATGLVIRRGLIEQVLHGAPEGGGASLSLPSGAVVLPGFVDPHLHLLAAAARTVSVDVGPSAAPDVGALVARLAAARAGSGSGWIRAAGWDGSLTADGLDPTLDELDAAVPDRPLVVHHATGHAALLNSAALRQVPDQGAVERGPDGRPTGLVAEPATVLSRVVPPLPGPELRRAVGRLAAQLAAAGVVVVADATHTNDRAGLELLAGFAADGVVPQRVVAMPSAGALAGLRADGASPGGGDGRFRLGHAKVMPDPADPEVSVAGAVGECRAQAWPAAVHCVEVDQLHAAVVHLAGFAPPDGWRHRLEHVALALPEQVDAIAATGLDVVTNPAFRVERAAKYERELAPPELGWLYRHRSLLDAGVRVAAASDAPTCPPRPLDAVAAAVGRRDGEAVDEVAALSAVTVAAAAVCSQAESQPVGGRWPSGPLRPGAPADLVVLDRWPGSADDARAARVLATLVAGSVIHSSDELPAAPWEPGALAPPN